MALLSGAAAQSSVTVQNSCSVPVDFTVIFQVPSTSDYFATVSRRGGKGRAMVQAVAGTRFALQQRWSSSR